MTPDDGEIVWGEPGDVADVGAASSYNRPDPLCAWGDPALPLDEKGRLLVRIDCQGCGADLFGQKIKGKCPNCSAAVGWSARGNRLNYADAKWVGSLRSGASTMLLGVLLYIGLIVAAVLIQVSVQIATMPASSGGMTQPAKPLSFEQALEQSMGPPEVAAGPMVIGLFCSTVMMVGVWKLTAREPGGATAEDSVAREVFRWAWLASAVLSAVGSVLLLTDPMMGVTVSGANTVVGIVATAAMLVYLRSLALRVPDPMLAARTQLLLILMLGLSVLVLVSLLFLYSSYTGSGPSMNKLESSAVFKTAVTASCFSIVAAGVLTVAWVMLLRRYRSVLTTAHAYAQRAKTIRG